MPKEISRTALAEAILSERPPIVLEALPRNHHASGHIPTAKPLPLDELGALVPQLASDKAAAIVVYCSSDICRNSHQAAAWLGDRGYTNVAVFAGGKKEWMEGGLRLDR